MTRAAAESIERFKPYAFFEEYGKPKSPSFGWIQTSGDFKFADSYWRAFLRIDSDRVTAIKLEGNTTPREAGLASAVGRAVDYLAAKAGMPAVDTPITTVEMVRLARETAPGTGMQSGIVYKYALDGHPYLSVQLRKESSPSEKNPPNYVLVVVIESATSQDAASSEKSAPKDASPKGADLNEWSYRVPGGEGAFTSRLASIHALLVRPMESGGHAAQAMKLHATVVPEASEDGNSSFGFNQPVGADMRRATEEVVRAIQVRHGSLPGKMSVKFGFEDKWGGKDGPSAAVACALLLESLLVGFEIPEEVAVTGDLNADSRVQPVGGVADKLRGAMEAGCVYMGIPAANEEDLNDLVVEENLRRFLTAKVFLLSKLEDALVLVDVKARGEGFGTAMGELEGVQKALQQQGAAALYGEGTREKLSGVLKSVPNCYTAKMLLAASQKRMPVRYSLVGSLMRVGESMTPYTNTIRAIREGEPVEKFRVQRDNPLTEARNRLVALKAKCDPRLTELIQAQEGVVQRMHRLIDSNATRSSPAGQSMLSDLREAGAKSEAQWKRLAEDREIQDQLMKRGIALN